MTTNRLIVNSLSRTFGSPGSYVIALPNTPLRNNPKDNTYVTVISCVLPLTYYPINKYNNTIRFTEKNNTTLVATGITIVTPPGRYSGASFAAAIQTEMNAATANALVYTITFNALSAKLTFDNGSAVTFTTTLNFSSPLFTAEETLGFTSLVDAPFTTGAGVLTSPFLIDLGGPTVIQIRSSDFRSTVYDTSAGCTSNIMVSVPVNSLFAANSTMNFYPAIPVQLKINGTVDSLHITLTDQYNNIIDFNGANNTIELGIFERD